jgi:16S rRNA (uracil1498-N3)-methyltransferase
MYLFCTIIGIKNMKNVKIIDSWFYIPQELSKDKCLDLPQSESLHVQKVFRAAVGDTLTVCNGMGAVWGATILEIQKKCVRIQCNEPVYQTAYGELVTQKPSLALAIGFLKGRDVEDVIDSCCQLPLSDIYILHTDYSQPSASKDYSHLLERLQAKSIVCLKQAQKPWLTQIHAPQSLASFLQSHQARYNLVLCHPDPNAVKYIQHSTPSTPLCLLTGPEGGFSAQEIEKIKTDFSENALQFLSLGTTRLRGVTAPIYGLGKVLE